MNFCEKLTAKIITLMDQDKRVIQYPRSLTDAIYDRFAKEYLSEILPKTMLCLETIEDRDALPSIACANHRMVRVHDKGDGKPGYFIWDSTVDAWTEENIYINEDADSNISVKPDISDERSEEIADIDINSSPETSSATWPPYVTTDETLNSENK